MRSSTLVGLVAVSFVSVPSRAFADYPECIVGTPTPEALTAWRLGAIAAVEDFDGEVGQTVSGCFPSEVPACLKRVQSYGGRNDVADAEDDTDYASTPQRQPPLELLQPGAEGFKYFVPVDIEQIAKTKGWPSVRYKSRHSGGFDAGTSSLLMVYVPGSMRTPPVTYDQWLNFALPVDEGEDALKPVPVQNLPTVEQFANEGGADYPRTFTMVTLERATDAAPAEVYFQMFNRDFGTADGVFTPQGNSSLDGCISCHPNGMRAISPLGFHVRAGEPQFPVDVYNATQLINEAMDDAAGGKLVSWRKSVATETRPSKPFMKPEAFWPIVGPIKPLNKVSRTQTFIMGGTLPDGTVTPGCFKRRTKIRLTDIFGRPPGQMNVYELSTAPQINWKNVRNAMLCETCHNNRNRYALTDETDTSTVDYKILVDQSMPVSAHQDPIEQGDPNLPPVDALTLDERIALANCLQAEMREEQKLLKDWLTQVSCN